jgi:hypothetical protein
MRLYDLGCSEWESPEAQDGVKDIETAHLYWSDGLLSFGEYLDKVAEIVLRERP